MISKIMQRHCKRANGIIGVSLDFQDFWSLLCYGIDNFAFHDLFCLDTCNPYDNGEANGPKRYNLAKFAFSDLITVNQYWSALTDICIDSVKTGLFAGIPVTAGIFSRKYRLLNNSSTVMDKLFVSKATDVGEFVTPKFETFG